MTIQCMEVIKMVVGIHLWIKYSRRVPLGEYVELTAKGIPMTATESYGGAVVTGVGLACIAATRAERLLPLIEKQ